MEKLIKNIAKSQVLKLKDQVNFQDGQIVSKTLVQNDAVSLTLFAFEKDEEMTRELPENKAARNRRHFF